MKDKYVLKGLLSDETWESFDLDNIEPYHQLKGLIRFYNELLENNGSVVIIDDDFLYDFVSYDYDYDTIKKAYDIITSYESNIKNKITLYINKY